MYSQTLNPQNSRPCGRRGAHTHKKHPLNVLIACEESQAECAAFRQLAHNAFSCDILPCRHGGHPEWHIHGDVSPYLAGKTTFITSDGKRHSLSRWNLIIAHPPCTYLCKVGSQHLYKNPDYWVCVSGSMKYVNRDRWFKMIAARSFFFECLNAQADYIAVENPIPMRLADLPPADCFACPSWFGVKYTKKTLYWLKNLPPIMAQYLYPNPKCYVDSSRGKYRSRTFPQLAIAIATQWSNYILENYEQQRFP